MMNRRTRQEPAEHHQGPKGIRRAPRSAVDVRNSLQAHMVGSFGGRSPMIITKMSLPRRTFLRGVGAAIALPWLDAMVPALSAAAGSAAPQRLGFVYVPNGDVPAELPSRRQRRDGLRADAGPDSRSSRPRARRRRQRVEQHAGARQRSGRRRAHPQSRGMAERRAAEADRRREHHAARRPSISMRPTSSAPTRRSARSS